MGIDSPLAFGGDGERTLTPEPSGVVERRPELHAAARKVIAILEPLDAAARLRVLRAAAILLELDGHPLGLY